MTLKTERATSEFSERVSDYDRAPYWIRLASDSTDAQGLPIAEFGTAKNLAKFIERDARIEQAFDDTYDGIDLDAVDFLVIAESCFDALAAVQDLRTNP